MNIETKRLYIRPFLPDDWRGVYAYTSDAAVMKYLPESVATEAEAKKFVLDNCAEKAKHFPVILKDRGTVIGHLSFFDYFGGHTFEIGWVLHPQFHGYGYASEAARAVVEHGFTKMGLHRVIATCQPENIPSHKVVEKIGMRCEGFFKQCIPHEEGWWDEYFYAIFRDEFLAKEHLDDGRNEQR